jgi:hypothetical protein
MSIFSRECKKTWCWLHPLCLTAIDEVKAPCERASESAELAATDSQHTQERHCFNCANYQGDLGCGVGTCSNLAAWVHNGVRA